MQDFHTRHIKLSKLVTDTLLKDPPILQSAIVTLLCTAVDHIDWWISPSDRTKQLTINDYSTSTSTTRLANTLLQLLCHTSPNESIHHQLRQLCTHMLIASGAFADHEVEVDVWLDALCTRTILSEGDANVSEIIRFLLANLLQATAPNVVSGASSRLRSSLTSDEHINSRLSLLSRNILLSELTTPLNLPQHQLVSIQKYVTLAWLTLLTQQPSCCSVTAFLETSQHITVSPLVQSLSQYIHSLQIRNNTSDRTIQNITSTAHSLLTQSSLSSNKFLTLCMLQNTLNVIHSFILAVLPVILSDT